MERRARNAFLALIVTQAAHSVEEYASRLFDVFAPARFASGLVGSSPGLVFAILNIAVVAFGAWCYFARVRPGHASAANWMWPWAVVEFVNGGVHTVMALARGSYFPGSATAPILLVLAMFLLGELLRSGRRSRSA